MSITAPRYLRDGGLDPVLTKNTGPRSRSTISAATASFPGKLFSMLILSLSAHVAIRKPTNAAGRHMIHILAVPVTARNTNTTEQRM